MTAGSIVVAGATTALSRRTNYRKAFLGPWHPLVEDIWLYALADAQREQHVAVHHTVRVINHHHTTVTASHDDLPEFKRRLHRDVSCALHTLLCRERYDAPRQLFDDRPTHTMRLLDAAAQASHLVYEYLNPVAAGLVRRPEHMPGRGFDFRLWKGGYIEVERPPVYFGKRRPARLRLQFSPPPLLYQAFGGDLDRLIYYMGRMSDGALSVLREARSRPVMGVKELCRLHPWSEPRTMREPGGRPVRTFRIGASGIVGQLERADAAQEVRGFRDEQREARIARRDGDLTRRFPYGTYAMRVYHGVPVEEGPPAHARVARPGPLLCDIRARLERKRKDKEQVRAESEALIDAVRQAFVQEAGEIVEHTQVDMAKAESLKVSVAGGVGAAGKGGAVEGEAGTAERETEERALVTVRHRFDRRRRGEAREAARRLITLRDWRRGRPRGGGGPSGGGRSGSDPPG